MAADIRAGAVGLRRAAPTMVIVFLAVLVVAAAPARAAKRYGVQSTDDAAAPGTCPVTNSFGYPTGGNCFIPDVITIAVGDTVAWKSTGQRPHNVVAEDGSFKSPDTIDPGQSWTHTFTKAGSFPYYCSLHGDKGGIGHAGKIVVSTGGAPPRPSPTPTATRTGNAAASPPASPAPGAPASSGPGASPGPDGVVPAVLDGLAPPASKIATTLAVTIVGAPAAAPRVEASGSAGGFALGLAAGLLFAVATAFLSRLRRNGAG